MSQLPVPREQTSIELSLPPARYAEVDQEVRLQEVWGLVSRHRWLILGFVLLGLGAAVFATKRTTPVYQAITSVRIDERAPMLPSALKPFSTGSEVVTEAEVLRSRTLAEDATASLSLQVLLAEPRRVSRAAVLDSIQVSRDAPSALYQLQRQPDGHFRMAGASLEQVAAFRPAEWVSLPGLRFRLKPAAARHEMVQISVQPFDQAVSHVAGRLQVAQAGRNANIVQVRYQDNDPQLVWLTPNAIVRGYISRRRETQLAEARSTIDFLHEQLDTISAQLESSEDALRAYRERYRVVDPRAEGSAQITRMLQMQSERGTVEAERAALAGLLAAVDAKAARQRPEDPSPYRDLLAFPTLLRSGAAEELLGSLATVEQERATLRIRRHPQDEDVLALTGRISELQGQLRSVVATYLAGLGNQIATLDSGLELFGRQLGGLPERELRVMRLERKPKVLVEMYTMLQTRLKEAEIARAAEDLSVRVVDPAVPPRGPIKPRPMLNLLAGLIGGLLLGLGAALLREYGDKTVHTRADVRTATGLTVLGMIPKIRGDRRRIAMMTDRRPVRRKGTPPPIAPARPRRTYTFWGIIDPGNYPPSGDGKHKEPEIMELGMSPARSAVEEAYSILQTNIAFARMDREVKAVVLTSPLPGDGKTTSSVNLALSLTRRGLKVMLIDADLRRGVMHSVFDVPRDPGLADVLGGSASLEMAQRTIEVEGRTLHFLTTGTPVAQPTALLESARIDSLLTQLRAEYDAIVLDSPPLTLVTDSALLSVHADGVILVARAGVTESAALRSALDQLSHVRAPVLGVVLNDVDFDRDASYDASYRYYNSYNQYIDSPAG